MPTPQQLIGQPHRQPFYWRLLDIFDRTQRPAALGVDWLEDQAEAAMAMAARMGTDRASRYRIFDEMDTFGLVQAVLNAYAEETTQPDPDKGMTYWVESKDGVVETEGNACLVRLQMEDKAVAIARGTGKYGDVFRRVLYKTGHGVLGWRTATASRVSRIEDPYERLIGFKETDQKFRMAKSRTVSWPWDYAHFRRTGGPHDDEGYGYSMCEQMFRAWRMLTLATDAMLMYRLQRAPDRNLIQVHQGNLEEHEIGEFLNKWRKRFRKNEFIDPASASYKQRYNPLTPLEDVIIGYADNREHRVEQLPSSGAVGEIYDIDYFVNEFFGSVGAPKAYFGYEGDVNAKATLIQQDMRWARACKRLRKSQIVGIRTVLECNLALLAREGSSLDKPFVLQAAPISYLDEFQRLELMQLRYQIVEQTSRMATDLQMDPRVWATYILTNFAKLPEEVVLKLISKVPKTAAPMGGAGGGFESLSPDEKRAVLDNEQEQRLGHYDLRPGEQQKINEAIDASPMLQHMIGRFAFMHLDDQLDGGTLEQLAARQTDVSRLPNSVLTEELPEDAGADFQNLKELIEDAAAFGVMEPLEVDA